jgi:hypothetical protein
MSAADAADQVFRLIYRSRDQIPPESRKIEFGTIFTTARHNNKDQHITGALLLTDEWFVQTLEGDEQAVRDLYDHIAKDPRHDEVSILETKDGVDRVFARWAMARVAEGDGEADINLIRHEKGIAEAASRGDTTPAQEEILATMRAAARGSSVS